MCEAEQRPAKERGDGSAEKLGKISETENFLVPMPISEVPQIMYVYDIT